MTMHLTQDRFPFQYRGKRIQIKQVDIFLKFRDPSTYPNNGTPLGDNSTGQAALVLNLTPPGSPAQPISLLANAALLNGTPLGTITLPPPGSLGAWTLVARGGDIQNSAQSLRTPTTSGGVTLYRLNADAIEDLYFVCHFSTN
jgi:hypothetical protein